MALAFATHGWSMDAQVDKQATSLNSSDVFVLCNKDQVTVWYGRHGSKDEREDGRGEMPPCRL